MKDNIRLIAGLGNPGAQYQHTRHNAGFEYVDALAKMGNAAWKLDSKYQAETTQIQINGQKIWLIKPMTYMNRSGQPIAALANFYKIAPNEILVAHDELDIPAGTARFKQGGGHGGHNGLRDIISHLANRKDFYRLRLGIGHPGNASDVAGYVLSKAAPDEQIRFERALDCALDQTSFAMSGDWAKAMNKLNSFKAD